MSADNAVREVGGQQETLPPIADRGEPTRARTLVDVLAHTAFAHPDAVAIEADGESLTYGGLLGLVEAFAQELTAAGIGPGDRVGVRIRSGTADLYVAILGVLAAGACYVPVDADDPGSRAELTWRIAGVCAVVGDGLSFTRLAAPASVRRPPSTDDDAWIILTSGSTGTPKAVAVTHASAVAFVDAEADLWGVGPADRVLAGLSVSFDASCEEMWLAWRAGATLVPAPREVVRSGVDFGPWLVAHRISVVSTVPTLASLWDEDVLAGVRLLILGGEQCPDELGWRLSRDRVVWNTYGPTEATVVSTAARIVPDQPVSIGWPLPGWEIAVVDEAGDPVSFGQSGELVIGGVGLGRYLDPELDAQRFAPMPSLGWERAYRSGDMVRETSNGLAFIGRRDEQVKIGGRRIELGEVDAALHALPGVRAAATVLRRTAGGNPILVGYLTGDVDPAAARSALLERLPTSMVPMLVVLETLPVRTSGKIDRDALPWPLPALTDQAAHGELRGTAAWLAQRWVDQLGPQAFGADSDFFEHGGSSITAAKLVTVLRERFPSVGVADVYRCRRLAELATCLDGLVPDVCERPLVTGARSRRWGFVQAGGILIVLGLRAPVWVLTALTINQGSSGSSGPKVGWAALVAAWLLFVSPPGRLAITVAARRLLLPDLAPGRYPRQSWLACRLWFVERLAEGYRLTALAGTPWAPWYARCSGQSVGRDVRLATLPPVTSLITIGDGAAVESGVDLRGWWVEGPDVVVGTIEIGAGARIGARSVLMPGARIGAGAEVEPGTVVRGLIPAGERWAGTRAQQIPGDAQRWPGRPAPRDPRWRFWQGMYGVGLVVHTAQQMLIAAPGLAVTYAVLPSRPRLQDWVVTTVELAPLLAALYLLTEILVLSVLFRGASRLLRPGWHAATGGAAWAVWFTQSLLEGALLTVFPLFASIYTRGFLRLLGVRVGPRTEMSHAVTMNRLVTVGATSFAADDVGFLTNRSRGGWIHLAPIEIGSGSFLGNGALLRDGCAIADRTLVGVLSSPPGACPDGTSWFGYPALELPRVPEATDPARTTAPPRSLVAARGTVELVRILLPSSVSMVLAVLLITAMEAIGNAFGLAAMLALAAPLMLAAGLAATAITVAAKWALIGRYRPGKHPLWSSFVWRDEIINSCQEQLAGFWLLDTLLGTPLMPWYLRAMGARVGSDVWFETLCVTEFDVVNIGDGCVINRGVHVETHLFHDRVMSIGPTYLGDGATLGPTSAVLPDTVVGAGCVLGARSVVLRGEELPPGTRWHGAPVVAMQS